MRLSQVAKAARTFDPEAERQRRLGLYEGAGLSGAVLGTGLGIRGLSNKGVSLKMLRAGTKKYRAPMALLAGGAVSGTGALVAHRQAASERNIRWS